MLFASFDELFEFVEGALTRLLGPFFVGAVITLVSMFVSFVWACDVPFLWNAGHAGAALFVAALALVFGYSVLYFYFMSAVVDPGRAPTVAEYAALCASRGVQSPEAPEREKEDTPGVAALQEDVDQVTFCTVDEAVLEPGRPHRMVECVVCSKCESQRVVLRWWCVVCVSRCCVYETGGAIKVPRSHHCKACERCTLKMDHHCSLCFPPSTAPKCLLCWSCTCAHGKTVWISNCVGYRNQKYFVLFLVYVAVAMVLFALVTAPLLCELLDRASPYRYVYSYGWTVLVVSVAAAVFLAVLGMGGFNLYQSALNITSVEMAQRQTYKRMVRHRERLLALARERGLSAEEVAQRVPPIHESFVPVDHSRGSVAANLRELFGARPGESLVWALLPHLRRVQGPGYCLSPSISPEHR